MNFFLYFYNARNWLFLFQHLCQFLINYFKNYCSFERNKSLSSFFFFSLRIKYQIFALIKLFQHTINNTVSIVEITFLKIVFELFIYVNASNKIFYQTVVSSLYLLQPQLNVFFCCCCCCVEKSFFSILFIIIFLFTKL